MDTNLQKINSELEYFKRIENKAMIAEQDHTSAQYQYHFGRFALCCHMLAKIDQLTKK